MKNILTAVAIGAAFCLGFAWSSAMTVLPKDISTLNRLVVLERGVKDFFNCRKRLPINLQELVDYRYVDACSCRDRWGNVIGYTPLSSNTVRLVSIGDPTTKSYSAGLEYRITDTFSACDATSHTQLVNYEVNDRKHDK